MITHLQATWLHGLWRKFPRGFRQDLYGRITGIGLAPASHFFGILPQPVTIIGALRAPTGVGQAARLAVEALQNEGMECGTFDLSAELFQPITEPPINAQPIKEGPGTLLFYVTPPNASRAIRSVPKRYRKGKTLVAGWVCETTKLPPIWRHQARHFNAITAPTSFCVNSISAATGRPVRLLGHPVDAEHLSLPTFIKSDGPPRIGAVLDVGSSATRKDVAGLVATLAIIVRETTDVELRLKMRDMDSDPRAVEMLRGLQTLAGARLETFTADEDRNSSMRFFDSLTLLLSMSRAEGFGLPYMEAIMRGVPVAAPRWGGPAEMLDDENSISLPFDLVKIDDPSGLYSREAGLWAAVDPQRAAHAVLNELRNSTIRRERLELPELATTRHFIHQLFSL